MTDQHPLTDEICRSIEENLEIGYWDMDEYVCMRAGADWQLEQVIQAWDQCYERFLLEEPTTNIQIIDRFQEKLNAMRPTTTQEDN